VIPVPTSAKTAASLSIGDRGLPLEADLGSDIVRTHGIVGKEIEVSPVAGGDLFARKGENGKVTGVFLRYGVVVGYEVEIEGKSFFGSSKDFYVDRQYLEDLQPPTATSHSLREGLTHWSQQRDYWHTRADGLEAFCFDLASVTPEAIPQCHPWGWKLLIPSPMPGDRAVVDCRAALHGNFWSLGTCIYPERLAVEPTPALIPDHWARVFTWSYYIAQGMVEQGFPWEQAARGIQTRAKATQQILRPMVDQALATCFQAKMELAGEADYLPPGGLSAAFSDVRLKAGTIGLLEPPTDRRPYSIMSISPAAVRRKGDYLQQVVLHECLHLVVGSNGGDPHNDLFISLSKKVGLRPEHRD